MLFKKSKRNANEGEHGQGQGLGDPLHISLFHRPRSGTLSVALPLAAHVQA